jgi:hypothetical protein
MSQQDTSPDRRTEFPLPDATLGRDSTDHSFGLSNPKNYLGGLVATAASGQTGHLIQANLVSMAGEVRHGAIALGLITRDDSVTQAGQEIINALPYESCEAALESFADLRGQPGRFVTEREDCREAALATFVDYEPLQYPLALLLAADEPISLPELAAYALYHDPERAREALISSSAEEAEELRKTVTRIFERGTDIESALPEALLQTDTYHSQTTYQLKSLAYNAGILSAPGADSDRLTPELDTWTFEDETAVRATRQALAQARSEGDAE